MRHIGGALDFLNSQGPDSSFLNCRKTDPRYGIDDPKRAGILVEQLAAEGGAALKTDPRYLGPTIQSAAGILVEQFGS